MTYAQCLADARELKGVLAKWGVPGSIEIQAGRGSDPWASIRKYLRMHHHTVSWYRGQNGSLTPILSLCKTGRTDVVGPLCNGYGGYDGIYRIICMGEANHPGKGGPITVDGVYVPANSARRPTWGTEWEGGYQDWENIDIPRYKGGMLEFMGRVDNALAEWSGRSINSQLEHSTWTARKIDRKNFTRARGIALTATYASKPTTPPKPEEPEQETDDMLHLIKADNDARWAFSDMVTGRRHCRSAQEAARAIWHTVASGGKVVTDGKNGPVIYPAKDLENLPWVGEQEPVEQRTEMRVADVQIQLDRLTKEVAAWKAAIDAAG